MFGGTAGLVLAKLESYKLKQRGNNQFHANSPFRPNSDSESLSLTITDAEHGSYMDHVSGEGGSLYQLADHFGIPRPEKPVATDTRRAFNGLEAYAQSHGLMVDDLKAAGWVETTHMARAALKYPTATGSRIRFIDGNKPKYTNEKTGYVPCWYGLTRACNLKAGYLILCNGEISTIAAQKIGLPAFAHTAGETYTPTKEMLQELRASGVKRLIVALDCDPAGRVGAGKIAALLTDMNPAIVDLGFSDHGDLADFVMLYAADSERKLLQLADGSLKKPETKSPSDEVGVLALAVGELTTTMRDIEKARFNGDVTELVGRVQAELDRIRLKSAKPIVVSFAELAKVNSADVLDRFQNPERVNGVKSYIPAIDGMFRGFSPELYTILGATGMGKSTIAVSLAAAFLNQAPGLIVPTESPPERWLAKLVSALVGIPQHIVERGGISPQQVEIIQNEYKRLEAINCHMIRQTSPSSVLVRNVLREGVEKYGYEWCIVDSGSRMGHPGADGVYAKTTGVFDGLQDAYIESGVPIFVTSQLGRDVSDRPNGKKRPRLDDAYGGSIVEHNSGVVFGLYNHNYYVKQGLEPIDPLIPANVVELSVLKNRWLPDDAGTRILLEWEGGVKLKEAHTRTIDLRAFNTREPIVDSE